MPSRSETEWCQSQEFIYGNYCGVLSKIMWINKTDINTSQEKKNKIKQLKRAKKKIPHNPAWRSLQNLIISQAFSTSLATPKSLLVLPQKNIANKILQKYLLQTKETIAVFAKVFKAFAESN